MANRRMNQFRYSLETAVVELFSKISFGTTGAPTLVSASPSVNQGIASVSRLSAGKYRITLSDNYVRLMELKHVFVNATAPAAPGMYVTADNSSAATPTIDIQFNSAGTATDPASGEIVLLQLALKNSSVM